MYIYAANCTRKRKKMMEKVTKKVKKVKQIKKKKIFFFKNLKCKK